MSSRHPLMAAAERATEDGAVLALVVYMDADGYLGIIPVGEEAAPYQWLGMLTRAGHLLMEPVDEPDE